MGDRGGPQGINAAHRGLCAVGWHLRVGHPALNLAATKWESRK